MHWLDRIAARATSSPRLYPPVFADGWGDAALLEQHRAESGRIRPIPEIDVGWSLSRYRDGCFEREGAFESPAADMLPAASRVAHVLEVTPVFSPLGWVVFMAAFNDHGYRTRAKLASRLAKEGVATLVLENPYYGARRPRAGQPISKVTDFFAMGSAAVLEGRALLRWLATHRGPSVGVAGYSMGGNIAALVSATTPLPIATAAMAASYSPGPVWMEGLLEGAIAWESLGGRQARSELASTLGLASALRFPPPQRPEAAILANPARDGYIPRRAFQDLHEHWPGSELRWIEGGHVSTMLWHKRQLVQAIVDSIERLADL